MHKKILVIGVGNEFRCDDIIGLEVVRTIKDRRIQGVEIIEASGEGTALMEYWKNYDTVFLIDAVSSGSKPGTIHRIDVQTRQTPKSFFHSSTHQFGVAEAVEMVRTLNQLPAKMVIYGIEGKNFSMGVDVTPEVRTTGQQVVEMMLEEIA